MSVTKNHEGRLAQVLVAPVISEKATTVSEKHNQVLFKVLRDAIVADYDPNEVVLVDIEPEKQKTAPDFYATRNAFGVDPVCVTKLEVEGRKLFRRKDGKRVQVKRIYNRMVFDELEVKKVPVPFAWNDDC